MVRFGKILSLITKSALDFAFPRRCIGCGKINPDGEFENICQECASEIKPFKGAKCLVCSEIVGDEDQPDIDGCAYCRPHPPSFKHSMASTRFEGIPRQIVIQLKYHSGVEYLDDIVAFMRATKGLDKFVEDAILVPVPLHYSRRFSRLYNQSELIAKCIIKAFPKANCEIAHLLKRIKRTKSQTTLDKVQRAENIHGAFEFHKTIPLAHTTRIIVIDDVMTTTATLSECAATFVRNGYCEIDAYVFSRRI